jgi:formate-dependent nitrite reductase membrane component NrfD
MWSRGEFVGTDGQPANGRLELPTIAAPKRAYDVRPRVPAWGWQVVAYTWTKSIAAGAFLAVMAAKLLIGTEAVARIALTLGCVALLFLVLTAGLLVADLKQPKRFLYVLLRPQWRSWLVRGAYALTAYGGLLTVWLLAQLLGMQWLADALLWPGAVLAAVSAVYTAFLFAQAKGRDFWQNPLLSLHLLAHALLAGGAVWLIADVALAGTSSAVPRLFLIGTLFFSLLSIAAEHLTMPPTTDARMAMDWITGPMGRWFWIGGLGVGHLLPLAWLGAGGSSGGVVAAVLALVGLYILEMLWVEAPQRVPLS